MRKRDVLEREVPGSGEIGGHGPLIRPLDGGQQGVHTCIQVRDRVWEGMYLDEV